MKYGICNLAVAPIRQSASDESEIVSQLVFGDFVKVLKKNKPWIKVKNHSDNYEGWMDFKQLVYIDSETYNKGIEAMHQPVNSKTLELTGPHGNLTVFLGASLPFFDGKECQLGNEIYTINKEIKKVSYKDIKILSEYYLNAPYLWGGKSMFGIDCSGLVQNVFKAINIQVPRDAFKQVLIGTNIDWNERQIGDIVFYTTSTNKVTHVGILVTKDEIIHAHGRVRIDLADEKGIYNDEQKKYTHHFYSVKRWGSFNTLSFKV